MSYTLGPAETVSQWIMKVHTGSLVKPLDDFLPIGTPVLGMRQGIQMYCSRSAVSGKASEYQSFTSRRVFGQHCELYYPIHIPLNVEILLMEKTRPKSY